jgi:hypothetical protein
MKIRAIVFWVAIFMAVALVSGCAPAATAATTKPDTVAAASITDDPAVFEKSIGAAGKWIICTTKDLVIDKDLVLEGDFVNGKKDDAGKDILQRKIALYTQDDKRNITARFTLTAKSLTVKSAMSSIQHGTFKGDLYVAVKNFELVDTTVEGNVYFASEEIKTTFKMDATSKITGKQEIKTK